MCTPIYIKMDAHDQLLLAEGVCSQLGIVEYHKDVWPGTKMNMEAIKAHELKAIDAPLLSVKQVRMSREATIPAGKAVIIPVTIEGIKSQNGPLLLEKFSDDFEGTGLEMERSLFQQTENGETMLTIFYTSRFTEKILKDMVIGEATDVQAVCQSPMVKADNRDTAFTVAIKRLIVIKLLMQQESNRERKCYYYQMTMLRCVNYLVITMMYLHWKTKSEVRQIWCN